ncbi:MAG: hypothetical protein EOM26_03390 [Alphaproteobacteria bacterium]|nr:hypothetical protein [Alphaproteobacteria bacterium]
MQIGSVSAYLQPSVLQTRSSAQPQSKPAEPQEPGAPPGGNVENRQPPPEPAPPQQVDSAKAVSALTSTASSEGAARGAILDVVA